MIAHWGIVISFFTLPLIILAIHLTVILRHVTVADQTGHFAYLWNFHRTLAALLAAMLGLDSWDKRMHNGGDSK